MALRPLGLAPASRASGRLEKKKKLCAARLAAAPQPPQAPAITGAKGGRAERERGRGRSSNPPRPSPHPARALGTRPRSARSPRGTRRTQHMLRSSPDRPPTQPLQQGCGGRLSGYFLRAGDGALKSSDRPGRHFGSSPVGAIHNVNLFLQSCQY
ncbi:hypothetical protein NDU88_004519 [Pleurodeles waltl]|uniref:Uncharacterized protein n=1 Tax=Pleurodeles waltl TaxID=8319 RepID=A0AAV7W8L1_PLEWA|nr:hypothetical protein NDU88_004519 [Pleurodeles waltl]